jgi:hypothetical protein
LTSPTANFSASLVASIKAVQAAIRCGGGNAPSLSAAQMSALALGCASYANNGDYDGAIIDYNEAIRLAPQANFLAHPGDSYPFKGGRDFQRQ